MTFAEPLWLLLAMVLPALWLTWKWSEGQRRYADDAMGASAQRQSEILPMAAFSGFIALAVLAMAQPQWGQRAEDAPRTGRDIVIVLDTSISMLAEDAEPNRLEAAKLTVRGLVDAVRLEGGHRLALVTFAGRSSLQVPLTLDYNLLIERLDATEVGGIRYDGSAIGDAIRHSVERVAGLQPGFSDLILISDGEDHRGDVSDASAIAKEAGVAIYSVGIGNTDEGAAIPVTLADGSRELAQYDGFPVETRLRPALLLELAEKGGGRYFALRNDPGLLADLFADEIADKPARELETAAADVAAHRFQWLLFPAFLLLAFALYGNTILRRVLA